MRVSSEGSGGLGYVEREAEVHDDDPIGVVEASAVAIVQGFVKTFLQVRTDVPLENEQHGVCRQFKWALVDG